MQSNTQQFKANLISINLTSLYKYYRKNNKRKFMDISQTSSQTFNEQNPPLVYKIKQYKPKTLLENLSFMLIRPPRFLYNENLLYPPPKYQKYFQIQEHTIPFKLTLYRAKDMKYVILYLHGNSSSRFQGYMQLRQLPPGVGLACFDFNGCGMRFQADYITLGSKQCKQVDIAAKYLKNQGYKVIGWGRSMGSVSLLLSEQLDIMIADSPFNSLPQLCQDSASSFLPSFCCCFFKCLFPCVFSCVQSDIRQKAGFDLNQLEIAKKVTNQSYRNKSLFIMAGRQDSMISFQHSQKIYDAFPGNKQIYLFDGTHNSNRPKKAIKKALKFAENSLGLEKRNEWQFPLSPKKNKKIKLKPIEKIQNSQNVAEQSYIKQNQDISLDQLMPIKNNAVQQKQKQEKCQQNQ